MTRLFALCLCLLIAVGAANPFLTLEQLRAKYGQSDGHYAKINGVELYYKDEGKGPVLLMVHGSQSSLRTWDGVVAQLKGRYRIIRYDIAPQGLSGTVSDAQAASMVPTDLAEGLLAKLGVQKITFVGVSSGGTLGIFLAAKRPDLVERLILSNTPADTVVTTHLVEPESFKLAQRQAKESGFQSQAFYNEFLNYFSGDPKRISPATRTQYYDMNRRLPEKHIISLVAQVRDQAKAKAAMASVTAPTLLIWGGADPLLPASAGQALESYLTKAEVSRVTMADVGHYPPLEVPRRFARLIADYVEVVTPR